mgnify:FL=1
MDISKLVASPRADAKPGTVTPVEAPGRFGSLQIEGGEVFRFLEKPIGDGARINGGFFVLSRDVLNRIDADMTDWERAPLEGLASDGQLHAYNHDGFWQPMDTLRDKNYLEELWSTGQAPWKVWP